MEFFIDGKRLKLSQHLIVYIISLLDPQSQINLSQVNQEWAGMVRLTRKYLELLPTIHQIPMFSKVGLDVLRIKSMPNGMTNETYKLAVGPNYAKRLTQMNINNPELIKRHQRQESILRIPGDASFFGVRRASERYNALRASALGFNPAIVYFDAQGMQVTQYVHNAQPVDAHLLQRAGLLKKLAEMAKSLHSSERFVNDVAVFERNEGLYDALKEQQFKFPEAVDLIQQKMSKIKNLFASYDYKKSSCHNDSTPSNYLYVDAAHGGQELIKQIDWEYSGNNDLLWDLVYFSIEAKFSKKQELAYLKDYFGEDGVTESILAWFTVYKPVVEWWITLWSWTQLAQGATAVDLSEYQKLGAERYEKTLAHLNGAEFAEAMTLIESEVDASAQNTIRPF